MPYAPPSRCHCGAKATRRGRCEEHQPIAWERPSANTRTLSGRERAIFRREVLRRETECRNCGATGQLEADHIIPIAEGGAHRDTANGQALCPNCHEEKTRAEAARRRRRTRRRTGA